MKYKIFFLFLFMTFLSVCFVCAQETKETQTFDDLLAAYLSADFLNASDCSVYLAGETAHKNAYKKLLENGTEYFSQLMEQLDNSSELNETQQSWLHSLAEDMCRKNPQAAAVLIEDYPRYYDLMAACRTEEAFSYLADEADALSPLSGFDVIIAFFMDEDSGNEDLDEQEAYDLRLLLVYLAIDGENIKALKSLKKMDEGFFFAAARLMEINDNPLTEKPFLTESYIDDMRDLLDDTEDSEVLEMAIGDKDHLSNIRKRLLNIGLADIPETKIERYSIIFLWYLKLSLNNGVLDADVLKKYSDFMGLYNVDNLPIRRALCSAAGKNSLTSESICAFIKDNPKFRTLDPVEICIYPELNLCDFRSTLEKGEE